jgi:superfamily II DNA or RNA helicase
VLSLLPDRPAEEGGVLPTGAAVPQEVSSPVLEMRKEGQVKFAFLTGKESSKRRGRIIDQYKRGEIQILLASTILDEGFDAPATEYLVLAGGGLAEHRQLQRIGRGMRSSEGKKDLTVVDFMDRGRYLGKHSKERLAAYRAEPSFNVTEVTELELEEMLNAAG